MIDASPMQALAQRRAHAARALVPLFLVSGATSLVYETLWARQLHWVFGTSQLAITTVLTAFMGGLAIGGFVGSRLADRTPRPILLYAVFEAFIGVYALVFPVLLEAAAPLYRGIWNETARLSSPLPFLLGQLVIVGVLLLPPTIAMGATLPLLARFATLASGETAKKVGRLYGANTLGAVLGTALAGFVLLPELGLETTTITASAMNLVLALVAAVVAKGAGELALEPDTQHRPIEHAIPVLVVAALTGFTSLVYEVSWFRLLTLILGASVHAFTIMLLAFLIGLGVGGWAGGPVADRILAKKGVSAVFVTLAWLQAGIGVAAWFAMYAYGELPFAFTAMYGRLEALDALRLLWPFKILLALFVMLVPTLLMGATFPFLVRAGAGSAAHVGRVVGRIYGTNTVGAILGASLGSLLLLPSLGIRDTVLLAAGVNLLSALVGLVGSERAKGTFHVKLVGGWVVVVLWAVALVSWKKPPWQPLLMTAGMYQYVGDISEYDRASVLEFAVTPYELLFYEEGLSSVVTVAEARGGNMWLANNGKVDASTSVDMPTQLLVAHLPFAFHTGEAKHVAVIGLASGITAGSVTLHDEPGTIEIVELEPAVVRASHYFDEYNHRPLEDGRVKLYANDGRNHIYLAEDATYDIIVSEPSNPWLSGVSNLFTREFLELGKTKLKKGGVWAQWVQLYGMDVEDVRALLGTFADAYPYVALFSTIRDADLVMVGSLEPLQFSEAKLDAFLSEEADVRDDLAQVDIKTGADLLARFMMDREEMERLTHGVERNTDDNMRIEYSAPLHLHDDTAETNFRLLFKNVKPPLGHVQGVDGRIDLARAYAEQQDWVNALVTLKDAHRIEPENGAVAELYDDYQTELQQDLEESQE